MKLLVANWKMNPTSIAEAVALAKATDHEGVVLCPPFPFLGAVGKTIKKATLGAQNVFWQNPAGPFTGEVSATQLKSFGVKYVIIGHSERRRLGETDEMIGKKVVAALGADLVPIVCVGETAEEKAAGKKEEILSGQLKFIFHCLPYVISHQPMYITYEPIWAISSESGAVIDTPVSAVSTIDFLKKQIVKLGVAGVNQIKFFYGGSVDAVTAASFLGESAIDGVLIGGASLQPEEMLLISKNK